jgi:hypothetical protein
MLTILRLAGGWNHGHPSKGRFYWEADIFDMAKKLGNYQKDIHMRKTGARTSFDHFQASRKKLIKCIQEVGNGFYKTVQDD